jgi:uncharacterized membrane protein
MTISQKVKSRKFWALVISSISLLITALFEIEIPESVQEFLTYIAMIALGGIAIEDTAKAIKNDK